MNFIIRNVIGANNAIRNHCEAMVQLHEPAMLVLLETRMTDHKRITEVLKFDSQIQSIAQGLSGEVDIM